MRRRKLLVALAGLAVVVAVRVAAVWPASSPLTRVVLEEITNGMTRAEVHATLGPARGLPHRSDDRD
jgi:hypothetical protein